MGPWYATREALKLASQVATSRDDASIDRALEAASRAVEAVTRRPLGLYPTLALRSFPWPDPDGSSAETLWIDSEDLISFTVATSDNGSTALTLADLLPEPVNYGPPYTSLQVNVSSSSSWTSGSTSQRALAITGLWGWRNDEETATTATATQTASTATLTVADGSRLGVGDVARRGNERMLVTGKTLADTTANLGADLAANKAQTTVPVDSGALVHPGEQILIDGEYMLVDDVAGNTLLVRRGWNGSTLAVHTTGADVYAGRVLAVQRGALGTTAEAHNTTADAVYRWLPPGLASQLCLAEAIATLNQQGSGYAATAGTGDNQREVTGRALNDLRKQAYQAYGVKARTRAV